MLVRYGKLSGYQGLVFSGYHHQRIDHAKEEFSTMKGRHINTIESFSVYAKRVRIQIQQTIPVGREKYFNFLI